MNIADIQIPLNRFRADLKSRIAGVEADLLEARNEGVLDEIRRQRTSRAIRAIAGSAGWFGLDSVRALARTMARCLTIPPSDRLDAAAIDLLLEGASLLAGTVADPPLAVDRELDAHRVDLNRLVDACCVGPRLRSLNQRFLVSLPDGRPIFRCARADFEEALRATNGDGRLVLLEFDLVRDIERKGRSPWDVLVDLMLLTVLVDSKLDAVGSPGDPASGPSIPFYALVATEMEPGLIEDFFELDRERIHLLPDDILGRPSDPPARSLASASPATPR